MHRQILVLLIAVPLLADCASREPRPTVLSPIERFRMYPQSRAETFDSLRTAVAQQGLEIQESTISTGEIKAILTEKKLQNWAICPKVMVSRKDGDKNRRRPANSVEQTVSLRASVTGTDQDSRVELSPHFTELKLNNFYARTFTVTCDSTGVLEDAILGAI